MLSKLNVGCRNDIKPVAQGWINLDIVNYPGVDIVANVLDTEFKPGQFDMILASDILEHFTKMEGEKFLALCSKWLKNGGTLEIRLPNINTLAKGLMGAQKEEDREYIIYWIYGDRGNDKHNLHRWGYTEGSIRKALVDNGLNVISLENNGYNMVIKAQKR